MSEGWTSSRESPSTPASDDYERQLGLVDRVLGLEAQLAELSIDSALTPSEQLRVEQQLDQMRRSLGWRIGRIITAPITVARRRFQRDR
jgi:hypothetical protein